LVWVTVSVRLTGSPDHAIPIDADTVANAFVVRGAGVWIRDVRNPIVVAVTRQARSHYADIEITHPKACGLVQGPEEQTGIALRSEPDFGQVNLRLEVTVSVGSIA
jgi:hypothetical protein